MPLKGSSDWIEKKVLAKVQWYNTPKSVPLYATFTLCSRRPRQSRFRPPCNILDKTGWTWDNAEGRDGQTWQAMIAVDAGPDFNAIGLHYVPGLHANHVSGHRGQNGMHLRQRGGTGWGNVTGRDCRGCRARFLNCQKICPGSHDVDDKPSMP